MTNRSWILANAIASAFVLSACGGGGGSDGATTLMSMSAEAAGVNCAIGGTRVRVGLDADGDGELQASEVSQTRYVCDGASGTTGATGAMGSTGATGTSGTSGTNGTNGRSALMALSVEPAGANCMAGGTRIDAGADSNANGTLEVAEITATRYVCNGSAATWINVTGTTQPGQANRSYLASNAALITVTLPGTPAPGDTVAITGAGAGGWKLAQAATQSIVAGPGNSVRSTQAQWAASGAGNAGWNPIAADASGKNVFAASSTGIMVSQDSGETFTTSLATADNWRGLAISPDGERVVAVSGTGAMQRSVDGGASWAPIAASPGGYLERVAMSTDGVYLLVAKDNGGGGVFVSDDSGATFTQVGGLHAGGSWVDASMSSDGQRMLATQNTTVAANALVLSTDFGATWTQLVTPVRMNQAAISADGSVLVGTSDGADHAVYTSKDEGVTWVKRYTVPTGNPLRVRASSDGQTLAVTTYSGHAYTSFNGGVDWSSNGVSALWYGLGVAGDGSKVFIGDAGNGPINTGSRVDAKMSVVGTAGFLQGAQYSGASLQYLGSAQWLLKNSNGTLYMPVN